ncbi:hypothetical protein QBC37DRAFT_307963 [Rhypophila decipiens]|uniref:Uncharacterized protein n=1 Tax=Rhypophila decipiens TaxID=261697 RepID=A0AAN7BBC1_9PEZI|nr:hypothetical protein QBC37DRAFT_307963 [Rhypophila decipiens]
MASNTSGTTQNPSYSQFACIGSGFSAICLGAQLQRWYGITDVYFFEKLSNLGGTWFANQYPGAACDIPAALYSLSFELHDDWTALMPPWKEIWEYLKGVADKYNLTSKITFNATVEKCEWINETGRWRLTIHRNNTNDPQQDNVFFHECQFLFSAAGFFNEPRDLDIPGLETFKGPVAHSSRWRHEIDLRDKNVVVIGNGCTGTQIVPAILPIAKRVTHLTRSKHYFFDRHHDQKARYLLRQLPGGLWLERFLIFLRSENNFRGFFMTKLSARFRRSQRAESLGYIRATAPQKYHSLLTPDFEVNCKRRIFDTGYLSSLHSPNLTLTNQTPARILPDGIEFTSGETIPADVLILANGFKVYRYHATIPVLGRNGTSLAQHFDKFGGPAAYNCTAMHGFPNFFLIVGPNSLQGHTSVIMAAENSVNFALRVLRPILTNVHKKGSSIVEIRQEAEEQDVALLQAALKKTIFFSGCKAWYLHDKGNGEQYNGTTYPFSQAWFWWRCLFPTWADWEFSVSGLASLLPAFRLSECCVNC